MKAFAGKKFLLVVENSSVPGDPRVWNEAQSLKNAGGEVYVVCPMSRHVKEHRERFVVAEGIHIYRYKTAFSDGTALGYFREYMIAFLKITFLVHKILSCNFPIHVLHAANPPDMFWPLGLYLKVFGTKFIFDEHDLSPETYLSRFGIEENNGGLVYKVQKFLEKLSYKFSNAIISPNASYRARAIRTNRDYALKTFIVRNGPDTRFFSGQLPNLSWKRGRSFLAAYVGGMAVQDGIEYIIRAADVIVNRHGFTDVIFYLIGSGDDAPRLQRLTHRFKLDDYIVFTGYIPNKQIPEIVSTADVCLSPDPSNPLNDHSTMTKIMEYMALSKPIVSFNLRESRYSAGDSAIYVENNNVAAFAEGILRLINDPDLSRKMGQMGKKRVEEELCWQKQELNLLEVYRVVLRERY